MIQSKDEGTPLSSGVYDPIKVKGFGSKPLRACKRESGRLGGRVVGT